MGTGHSAPTGRLRSGALLDTSGDVDALGEIERRSAECSAAVRAEVCTLAHPSLMVHGFMNPDVTGVALYCGATTLPAFRRRGVQAALVRRRRGDAAAAGGDLAGIGSAPGSLSQRSAMREGFWVLYARAILVKPAPGTATAPRARSHRNTCSARVSRCSMPGRCW